MTKISRNAPCPCGSGIKYKKCCLPKHKAEQATVSPEVVPPAPARARVPAAAWAMDDDDDLDELSNSAVDLIKEGRLDEAEAVGKELLERYPEVHDGLERLAAVSEARGDFDKALGNGASGKHALGDRPRGCKRTPCWQPSGCMRARGRTPGCRQGICK